MKRLLFFLLPALLLGQNVVWDSPSKDASGSMPLGNGDIGLNVWVEESGDLAFYIGKTDAWSEAVRLLKLGRVRVRFSPNPFEPGQPFRQTLNLERGEIVIEGADTKVVLWVDANNPVIRVEAESKRRLHLQAFYERWRDQQRVLEGKEAVSAFGLDEGPEPVVSYPDAIVLDGENRVTWYHRNARSAFPAILKHQGLGELLPTVPDPLLNRTFGATMFGDGLTRMNPTALRSREASQRHALSVVPFTSIAPSADDWTRQVTALSLKLNAVPVAQRRAAHDSWWQRFWQRSWIRVQGGGAQDVVTQGYALQRFITAAAGRGAYPIKFNGSIFTVDAVEGEAKFDADYRRWGGPYWFQNTRLIYWPLLASGDHEMMQPFFGMFRDAQYLAKRRTRIYFDHDGVFFPETMYFWGTFTNKDYGWKREGQPPSYVESRWIGRYYSCALELLVMMLDYVAYTDDRQFVRTTLAPLAEDVLRFYDQHYKRDAKGLLVLAPAQSLETWQDVVNPLPDIAGLRYVLDRIAPLRIVDRALVAKLQSQVPPIPTDGKVLLPAEKINEPAKNVENPELYAIFPYRIFGVNKPGYDVARATFEKRKYQRTGGWQQDAIQAASLGMAETARGFVVDNFSKSHEGSRFPAFWGPNFDWVPDQDHGSVAMMALQAMLLQADGDKLLLLPAWPKDWDVEFKLNAPKNTTIEGVFRKGKMESLRVTPQNRAADIIRLDPQ